MARDRDWVDYANLASNVIQNAQLSSLNGKMQELAELTRQKEYREQEKDVEERREAILRDAVFQADRLLRNLRGVSIENPRAAMAWARQTLYQFERNGVTTASFRSYEDKERLRSVVDGHEGIVQQCAASLSLQQQGQAERCGQFLAERDELNLLIELKERPQQLDKTRDELKAIENAIAKRPDKSMWLLGFYLPMIIWMYSLFFGKSAVFGISTTFYLWAAGVFLVAAAAHLLFKHFKAGGREAYRVASEAASRRPQVVAEIAQLESQVNVDSMHYVPRLQQTFGKGPLHDLLSMRNGREALIAEVLKNPKPDVAERPPVSNTPPAGTVFVIIGDAPPQQRIPIIKAIREANPDLSLAVVKGAVDSPTHRRIACATRREAEVVAEALHGIGITAEISNSDVDVPPISDELEMLAARVGSENSDWIIKAIRSGTPAAEQAAIELYAKLAGTDPAEAGRAIAAVKNQILPRRGRLGTA